MFPFLPSLPNNIQAPGCSGLGPQQMVLPNLQQQVCNPCSQPNPVGFGNMQQIQSQLHAHHQFQSSQMAAFNNQNMDNMHGSGMVMPNHPQLTPSHSLTCTPNIPLAVQASLIGMQPQHGHSCLHHNPQNLNQIATMPFHGQICNVPQTLNQLGVPQLSAQFGINSQMRSANQVCPFPQGEQLWPQNLSQNLGQVMGLHGQFCLQNPIHALNQIQQLSQHAVGTTQPGPFNIPQASLLVAAGHGSQNTFLSNSHLGPRNIDSGFGNALISTDPTKSKGQGQDNFIDMAIASQNAAQKSLAAMQTPQTSFTAVSTKINVARKILPSDSVHLAQVSHTKNGKTDISAAKFGNSACRNFNRNHHGIFKRDQSHRRFQKPNRHVANGGSFSNKWGPQNGRERKPQLAKYENKRPDKCQRRAVSLRYTEEEIKQWCEARKRNFPTAANIKRKKLESNGNHEVLNENAKICRQQLKEVLTKQMELGFEAAEVPSHYLSDPENILCERNGKKESCMAVRFPDKYGKRGRHSSEKWHSKRQKSRDQASPVPVPRKREPTLLQKLLSSEIKRDQSRLLQVFRFMTLNSFFEHWPDKPLVYPQVTVKDLGCEVDCAKGKSLHGEDGMTSGVGKNLRAVEVDGQAKPGAGDEAEESADESICVSGGDRQEEEEDTVHISRAQPKSTEDGEISG